MNIISKFLKKQFSGSFLLVKGHKFPFLSVRAGNNEIILGFLVTASIQAQEAKLVLPDGTRRRIRFPLFYCVNGDIINVPEKTTC